MSGVTPEMAENGKKRMPLYAFIAFIASMVVAYVMNYFGIAWEVHGWIGAIQLGFWCWVGFVAPTTLGQVLWDHKPIRLYFINILYWLVTFVAIAIVLVLGSRVELIPNSGTAGHYDNQSQEEFVAQALSERTIDLGGQTIRVSMADTSETRGVGLGGRAALAPDEGMLFVFPQDGKYGFWMKNMRFSIDILWLTADGRIVYLAENISPETYPEVFASAVPARYVLELPAGFIGEYFVKVGDIVRL